jgi:hypothetical protein
MDASILLWAALLSAHEWVAAKEYRFLSVER